MHLTKKIRAERSQKRKDMFKELAVWDQRVKDMSIAAALKEDDVPEKLAFVRQEQAKLLDEIYKLDIGCRKQRAWNQGKLVH